MASPDPDARPRAVLLAGLLLGVTLHAFHAMAIVVIVPVLADDLDGRALYGAVFSAYLLASLVGLIAAGDRVDRLGPRRPLAEGLACFALGLVGAALAPTMEILVAARLLEGLGGGALSAVLMATVNREYGAAERPRILAAMSAAWVLPGLVAPPVAAWITDVWGWRWVFLGVLPLVVLAAALALPALAATPVGTRRRTGRVVLAAQLVAGAGLILLAFERLPALPGVLALVVGAVVGTHALARVVPAGARRPPVATRLLTIFVFFGADTFLPLAFVDVRQTSLLTAGALMTTGAVCWSLGAYVQSRVAGALAPTSTAAIGIAAIAAGIAGEVVALDEGVPLWIAFVCWAWAGLGMGVVYNVTGVVAMAATGAGQEGETSTALGVADALGFALVAGVGGAVLAGGEAIGWSTGQALTAIWLAMVAVSAIAWLAARGMPGARTDAVLRSPVASSAA